MISGLRKATTVLHGGRAVGLLRGEGRTFFLPHCLIVKVAGALSRDKQFELFGQRPCFPRRALAKFLVLATMCRTTPAVVPFLVLLLPLLRQALGSSVSPGQHRRSLSCFQCSWLAEQPVDSKREDEVAKRWMKAYERSEDAIDNPFKRPLLGVETFAEMPTRTQLAEHCDNCTKADGMCARWTFYGSTGQPLNVTWMCVNSLETGCFVEHMASHFVKEVCLCQDRHHCNAAGAATPISLVVVLISAVWIAVLRKVLS